MSEAPVHIVAGASLVPERELTAVTQAFNQRRTVSSAAWVLAFSHPIVGSGKAA
jgi:hypothetical protein